MFIRFKEEKTVNLDNVSNIYIEDINGDKGKVIFNMNYSVKIFGDKYTPDYVYWMYSNREELLKITSLIEEFTTDWVKPVEPGHRYVNPTCISSIGFDENKNRVIFNLNYNVTHPKDDRKLTSDFVFYNFSDKEKFLDFSDKLFK